MKLWQALRARPLGAYKWRRQLPIARFVADFACVELRLVVELDGHVHHGREAEDAERTAVLEAHGWRVIRLDNAQVLEDVNAAILRLAAEAKAAGREV